jgi:hypothetical protein
MGILMYLRLNEQEIIDGICVAAAQELDCDLEEVDVHDMEAKKDGDIHVHCQQVGRMFNRVTLHLDDIMDGIVAFLVEFHSFSPETIVVRGINHDRQNGFWAEVTVGE